MKIFVLILAILFLTIPVHASWFVVDKDNNVIAKAEYVPSEADLATRNEISVYTKDNVPLEKAEYRGGKIVAHKDTASELAAKAKESEVKAEQDLIDKRTRKIACEQLKAEGVNFKQIKCEDLDK